MAPALNHEGDGVGLLFLDLFEQLHEVFDGHGQILNAVDQAHLHQRAGAQMPAFGGIAGILGYQAVYLAVAGLQQALDIVPAAVYVIVEHLDIVGQLVLIIVDRKDVAGEAQLLREAVVAVPEDVGVIPAGHLERYVGFEVLVFQVFPFNDDVELLQQDLIQDPVGDRRGMLQVVRDREPDLL